MSKLKPVTEISNAELLDLLQPGEQKPIYESKTDVLEFLSFYRLKEGENRVTGTLLYNLYKRWSQKPRTRIQFTDEVIELFPMIRYGHSYVFLVNRPKDELLIKKAEFKHKKLKTKSKKWYDHFQTYIKKYSIKTGRFYVKDVVLYNLYDKWLFEQNRKHLLSPEQFNHFCKVFFKSKKIKGCLWFAVEKGIQVHLSNNLLELMKQQK